MKRILELLFVSTFAYLLAVGTAWIYIGLFVGISFVLVGLDFRQYYRKEKEFEPVAKMIAKTIWSR